MRITWRRLLDVFDRHILNWSFRFVFKKKTSVAKKAFGPYRREPYRTVQVP